MNNIIDFQAVELNNEALKRAYKITIPSHILTQKLDERINEAVKGAKIDGFRPGKVPASIIKSKYNDSLQAEVMEKVIDQSFKLFLDKQQVALAEQPKIELKEFKSGEDLEYHVSFEILPEIVIPDYSDITVEKLFCEVGSTEIQNRLKEIASRTPNYAKSDKSITELNDVIVIDFEGKINGIPFDGGSAKDMQVELGGGKFLPDFEKQLIGATVNQPLQVTLTFPNDYMAKDLAGKEAIFDVTIKEILVGTPYEVSDELAIKLGFENLTSLEEKVKEIIEQECKQAANTHTRKQLFDQLENKCNFPVPVSLEEKEFNALWQRITEIKKTDPEMSNKTDEELKQLYHKMANRRVKLGLLLAELGKKHNFSITQDELRQAVYAQSRMFPGQEHAILDYYRKNPRAVEQLKGPIIEDKVVELLLGQINSTKRTIQYEELLKATEIKDNY